MSCAWAADVLRYLCPVSLQCVLLATGAKVTNPRTYAVTETTRVLVWGAAPLLDAALAVRLAIFGAPVAAESMTAIESYARERNPDTQPPPGVAAFLRKVDTWVSNDANASAFTLGDYHPSHIDLSNASPEESVLLHIIGGQGGPFQNATAITLPRRRLSAKTQSLVASRGYTCIVAHAETAWSSSQLLKAPLARLSLSGVRLDEDDIDNIASIQTLKHLGLRQVVFPQPECAIGTSSSLQSLWMVNCSCLTNSGLASCLGKSLTELVIRGAQYIDDRVWKIVSAAAPYVQTLRIEECPRVQGDGMASMYTMPLTTLTMRFSSISPNAVVELMALVHLQRVDLSGTPVSAEHANAILRRHPTLRIACTNPPAALAGKTTPDEPDLAFTGDKNHVDFIHSSPIARASTVRVPRAPVIRPTVSPMVFMDQVVLPTRQQGTDA